MWTRKASLVTGMGATAVAAGVAASSPAALSLGLVTLAFVLVNRLLFRGSAEVAVARDLDIHRVYEGDTLRVDLRLENPGKRLIFLEARDRLPRQVAVEEGKGAPYDFVALPRGGVAKLHYELRAPLLGVYEVGPTQVRIEDPFGLFYEERDVRAGDTLWVVPRIEDLRKAALLSRLPLPLMGEHQVNRPGDGFDFFALREYAAGDTMRMVNWKASGRTGKMMVNQMERTTAAEVTVIVDGRAILDVGPEASAPRVLVGRATASFVDFLYKSKDMARVLLYSDHVREIEPMPAERMIPYVLETMAELKPKGAHPLSDAVRQALPTLKPQTPVILISPLLDDPTILEAASILLANDMLLTVVTPDVHELPGADPAFARALLDERDRTVRELQAFGAFVVHINADESIAAAVEKSGMVVA